MSYDYDYYPPYVSVADRKAKAAKMVARLKKKDKKVAPVVVKSRIKIAHSFWGQAWCRHIETYRDMSYRLERGRSYVRSGAVVDLRISKKKVVAKVSGSELYKVSIDFESLAKTSWNRIVSKCSGEIDSLVDLLNGKLPSNVSKTITDPKNGLFPQSGEIKFNCNCPDYADCCKHVAATLYGIGVHFDEDPMLFFLLRGQDPKELIAEASKDLGGNEFGTGDDDIEDLFGIEIDYQPTSTASSARGKKSNKKSATRSKKATATKKTKTKVVAKKATKKKAVSKKVSKKKTAKKQTTKKAAKKSTSKKATKKKKK
ncbi:MAG: SWIM zinc finger family protein [Oligoflexales bacterium]